MCSWCHLTGSFLPVLSAPDTKYGQFPLSTECFNTATSTANILRNALATLLCKTPEAPACISHPLEEAWWLRGSFAAAPISQSSRMKAGKTEQARRLAVSTRVRGESSGDLVSPLLCSHMSHLFLCKVLLGDSLMMQLSTDINM